jgi:hypothetical protein
MYTINASLADMVLAEVNVDTNRIFQKGSYVLVIIGNLINYIIYKYVLDRFGKLSWTIHSFHFTLSSAIECAQND